MKKYILLLLFVLGVSGSVFLPSLSAENKAGQLSKLFAPAPDFTLEDINQDEYSLSAYKGKQPVLLFFWTTWCPYCQKELRILNNMSAVLAQEELAVFAVNVGEDTLKVQDFVKTYHLSYKVLLDQDGKVSQSFGIMGVPTYVIIDKEGRIVFQDNYFPNEYKDLIAG
jgi:peroxiredoxin